VFDSQTDIATAFCPFDQATQDEYVAMLERARAERIFYSSHLSAWVVARYDDIDVVLRDPVTFSSKGVVPMSAEPGVRGAIAGVVAPEGTLIGWDPPDHSVVVCRTTKRASVAHREGLPDVQARPSSPTDLPPHP
jgi:cytochrome P450